MAQQDGQARVATCYLPVDLPAPALLLLHGMHATRKVWKESAERLAAHGYLVLCPELELHGLQGASKTQVVKGALKTLQLAEESLREKGADPENIFIMGEGLGASLALLYAKASPTIQGAIALSPGLSYQGVDIEYVFAQLQDCPTLLLASENDAYAAASAQSLKNMAQGFCEYRSYPGSTHGANLLLQSPNAFQQVLQWLKFLQETP